MIFQQNTSGQMKNIRAKIKSKTYPEDETAPDALITMEILMKLLKCLKDKRNIERTFILSTDGSSTKTLQGLVKLSKLRELILLDNMTYQQYISINYGIKKTIIIINDSIEHQWIYMLFVETKCGCG